MKIKFAHLADCHLGAWRNENLNQIGYKAFEKAIDIIIEEKVDFAIISGDLFDVSNPRVDVVDLSVRELKKLKDNRIPVYGIMGSHDFSPSDKSMIRPLITAGLFTDVSKGETLENDKIKLFFFQDPKTKIKITGLRARKRSLEIEDYNLLDRESLELEKGIKIFVLHTLMSELKPKEYKDMESAPKSLLPQNFDYYAGGHLHKTVPEKLRESNQPIELSETSKIIYPGSLYPTDFRELEKNQYGGFCLISGDIDIDSQSSDLKAKFIPIKIKEVVSETIDCNNKTVREAIEHINKTISKINTQNKIVTVRIIGTLTSGKTYEIKSHEIRQQIKENGAYEVFLNKNMLVSKEYLPINVAVGKTNKEIEDVLVHEHAQQTKIRNITKNNMEQKIHRILGAIGIEREEGAKVKEYNEEVLDKFLTIFDLHEGDGSK
ncbi:MAG: exonuclease SbcCD subunit D [Promethearchaeota archaeon]